MKTKTQRNKALYLLLSTVIVSVLFYVATAEQPKTSNAPDSASSARPTTFAGRTPTTSIITNTKTDNNYLFVSCNGFF